MCRMDALVLLSIGLIKNNDSNFLSWYKGSLYVLLAAVNLSTSVVSIVDCDWSMCRLVVFAKMCDAKAQFITSNCDTWLATSTCDSYWRVQSSFSQWETCAWLSVTFIIAICSVSDRWYWGYFSWQCPPARLLIPMLTVFFDGIVGSVLEILL